MDDSLPLIIAAGAGIGLSSIYLLFYAPAPVSTPRSAVKTGSVLCLALAAALGGASALLVAALLACALGDYALSRPGQKAFLGGMAAFALGHLFYIALMLPGWAGIVETWQVLALVPLVVLCLGMIAALWPRSGALRIPVTAYALIICAMGLAAIGFAPAPLGMVALAGAGLFIASDTVLAFELFILTPEQRATSRLPRIVWVLYFSAQLLLAVALGGMI